MSDTVMGQGFTGRRQVQPRATTQSQTVNMQARIDASPEGDGSMATRRAATQLVPFNQLTPAARAKLNEVVSRPTIFRRLPVQTIESDPDMYVFLVRHPEVIVDIWKMMGVSQAEMKRTGPFTFTASDGVGTESTCELVYGRSDRHIYYGEGLYDGNSFGGKVRGKCVLILSSGYHKGADGTPHVTHQMDVFLKLERGGMEWMARTFFPLVAKTTDYNFVEASHFLTKLSRAAESNGPGIQRMAERMTSLDPEVRKQFVAMSTQAHHRAILRTDNEVSVTSVQQQAYKPPTQ